MVKVTWLLTVRSPDNTNWICPDAGIVQEVAGHEMPPPEPELPVHVKVKAGEAVLLSSAVCVFPLPVPESVSVIVTVNELPDVPMMNPGVGESPVFGVTVPTVMVAGVAAATYGPTNGPPLPTGAAPAGWTEPVPVSARARARFSRPLPVCSTVPAASALRARRPMTTPTLAVGSTARRRAAAPATSAAEADVPVTDVVPPPALRVVIDVPGAARNVSAP